MKICEYTMPEIRFYLAECNFTEDEAVLFQYRTKDVPFEECAERMNISTATVYRLSDKMKAKVRKVDEMCKSGPS